jgi:hypothetical protein
VGYILLVNGLSEVIADTSLLRRMGWSFLLLFATYSNVAVLRIHERDRSELA